MKTLKNYSSSLLLAAAIIMLAGCSKSTDLYDENAQAKINAVKLLGPIDSRHDWTTIYTGTVTVSADMLPLILPEDAAFTVRLVP